MLIRLGFRNLMRGWRRSLITVAAVGFGLGAAVFVVGLSKGMMFQMTDTAVATRLAHLAVHPAGYWENPDVLRSLPGGGRATLELLEGRPGVAASARVQGEGLVQSARRGVGAILLGVDPVGEGRVSSVPHSLVEGTFLEGDGSTSRRSRVAPIVLGRKMAERLRVQLGDKIVVHAPGETGLAAFRVRGIYQTASSEFDGVYALLRLSDAQALFGIGDRVTEVAILLDRPGDALQVQEQLRQGLAGSDVEVLRWEERAPRLAAVVQWMDQVAWIFYSGVFVAMAFGIANVLFMGVYERIREFGIMRAVGLRPRGLVATVLAEALILTMVGTAVGLALGFGLIGLFAKEGLDLAWFSEGLRAYGIGTAIRPRVSVGDLGWPVAIATITAIVSGLSPAIRVARLRPAEALRRT